MIKNECKIVKDLLPNYVEDLISKETKEFVENHIENCKNCKDTLALLKGDKKEEEQKEEKSEEEEIKHLKKYNRKMTILKSIASVLAIFIVIMWAIIIVNNVKGKIEEEKNYYKCEYISEIMENAYEKIEEKTKRK